MGTSLQCLHFTSLSRDHPHAYGDKSVRNFISHGLSGSSPRVWGQVCNLIPVFQRFKDHPHAYGDKTSEFLTLLRIIGSSPRVWGQEEQWLFAVRLSRIIPTRMGTRESNDAESGMPQDHPHAYGDKAEDFVSALTKLGSSPRVWGQDFKRCCLHGRSGIIPTRMGTRSIRCVDCAFTQDHPHAYGDKTIGGMASGYFNGSSPRVWGQGYSFVILGYKGRIIPTRMGTRGPLSPV